MEKKKLNLKLSLNKETIEKLDKTEMEKINGGEVGATGMFCTLTDGCTDGCGLTKTWYNCTEHDCTRDCGPLTIKDTLAFCTC